jgi:HEPN domain-containing protein
LKKLTQEWVKKAENDFIVTLRESNAKNPIFDAICYHSQQSVEKYIKSVMQENEVQINKTHDLVYLVDRIMTEIPEMKQLMLGLTELNSWAVEVRYPGVEATKTEADSALETAKEIRKIIRDYLKLSLELPEI